MMDQQITVFNVFFGKVDFMRSFTFYRKLKHEKKTMLVALWRRVFLATYFIGIMRSFQNRVKIFGAIRQDDHMNMIEDEVFKSNQEEKKTYMFYPDEQFKTFWNLLLIFLLLATAVITPFKIDSGNDGFWFWIDIIFDVLFFADIVINFLSAFFDEEYRIIDDYYLIAKQYITGWFVIDFIAVLPITYFLDDNTDAPALRYNKLLRLIRLPRLYRLARLLKISKTNLNIKNKTQTARILSYFGINEGIIKGLILLGKILLINHLVACFWYFVAKFNDFEGDTWVAQSNLKEASLYNQYIASFEWSLQTLTTVGYGDIRATTTEERIFAIIWMIFGTGFFSYTLGKLSSILENVDKKWVDFERRMHLFNDFSVRVKLPYALKCKVHKYYRNNYLKNVYTSLDPKKLIQELPSQLRNELLMICYKYLIESVTLLKIDNNFTATILLHLNFLEVHPGEIIYREDDPPTDIYFIEKGKVNFVTHDKYTLITLLEASFFGEIEAFEDINREYFAIAKEPTNLFFCSYENFRSLLKEFPSVASEVKLIYDKRKQKYKTCLYMIELQRKRNSSSESKEELQNSTQYYLGLIAQYEEEQNRLNYNKGLISKKSKSVLDQFSFKKKQQKMSVFQTLK
ncbi:unnamed protein product (macronuclear) [Paramecium tetraurelia]|uniref:Cyclic nucleotide-binding domain-containing protein n=1 Tax=Paramecium tetraurelia TaxID=5888 RepID=A0E3X9_PARTE|nr:uncharacterized protein GSPATT00023169001 [Paramecium tetraurelia]CAK89996.1 unnamed protein product [Paramecium tetraurelia]|eukprot:XP_001457393.1 hypothetical protein (macronuclear) [Paramecium tetraurelia strain d4-2]